MARLLLVALCVAAAMAAQWNVTIQTFATISAGIAFTSEMEGIAPVGQNGQGSFVWVTNDGGNTWNPANAQSELMYLAAAANGQNGLACAAMQLQYSNDNNQNFNDSNMLNGFGPTSQDAQADSTNFYVIGETMDGLNGVAVSADAGANFKFINISVLKTDARYGAFPSPSVWYISAGEWPDNGAADKAEHATIVKHLSRRVSLYQHLDGTMRHELHAPRPVAKDAAGSWRAQIVKSTDAGNTWTSVFYETGFYFNQIACGSEKHCCAAGEADEGSKAGIRIWCTFDGTTWNQTLWMASQSQSLMALEFISDMEAWAGGGDLSTGMTGYFWHTTDGGMTWTPTQVQGVYANDFSFPSADRGYCSAFNEFDESSFLTYM